MWFAEATLLCHQKLHEKKIIVIQSRLDIGSQVARRKTSFLMGGPDIYRKYLLVSGKNGDRDADRAELLEFVRHSPFCSESY